MRCPKCKTDREDHEFISPQYGKQTKWCITCRARQRAIAIAYREPRYEIARNYLAEHGCSDCGEKDSVCLHFDHVKPPKLFEIGKACRDGVALPLILAEIAKCEVRCANCHLKRTKGIWTIGP